MYEMVHAFWWNIDSLYLESWLIIEFVFSCRQMESVNSSRACRKHHFAVAVHGETLRIWVHELLQRSYLWSIKMYSKKEAHAY